MAIDLTSPVQPAFGAVTGAGTTCTQIRGLPGHVCKILASGAIRIFNGVEEGGAAPGASKRLELTADEAAQGYSITFGGRVSAGDYATVCISAASGTVDVRASSEPAR